MMLLTELLPQAKQPLPIVGIKSDSRQVEQGDVFFAIKGIEQDGRGYIEQAINNGAVAVVYEAIGFNLVDKLIKQYPFIEFIAIADLIQHISLIAGKFYGEPANSLRIVGVTGTNGKTSISQLIAQSLTLLGEPCGIIGTLGIGFWKSLEEGKQTTPDAMSIQKGLATLKQQGAKAVALEVSSHGLDQFRVTALPFKVAIFSNLTRDHLDYHGSLEAYAKTKAKLFAWSTLTMRVINKDDEFGQKLIAQYQNKDVLSYSLENDTADIYCQSIVFDEQGVVAKLVTPYGIGTLKSRLIGRFNLSNLLAVVGSLLGFGYELAKVLAVLPELEGPEGRMQKLGGNHKPLVIVDYAHTPDALEQVLKALRPHVIGKLICVFGCGGNRDKGKRPLMAAIAEHLADEVIVTDDNPRHEDSVSIIDDITKGFKKPDTVNVIVNRQQAIASAITQANAEDIVLLAGKGHENYQEIAGVRHHFSDLEEANQVLLGWNK